MKRIVIITAILISFFIGGTINELSAQPEFATVRLVTAWGQGSVLFVTRGGGETEKIELKQKYADRKQDKEFSHDNTVLNSVFEVFYSDGYKLVSTATTDQPGGGFVNAGREVLYLLVKE